MPLESVLEFLFDSIYTRSLDDLVYLYANVSTIYIFCSELYLEL